MIIIKNSFQLAIQLHQNVPWPLKEETVVIIEKHRDDMVEETQQRKDGYLATPDPARFPTHPPESNVTQSRFEIMNPDEPKTFSDAW